MLLENKNAIVYGAAGSMGGAVARAFASAGANVFLAGRTMASLEKVAEEIRAGGGVAETASVDAMDQRSVAEHADEVVATAGRIDICFNAIGITAVQNVPLVEISLQDFMTPITEACTTHFVTATTVARHMIAARSGVILMLSSTAARESRHEMGGFNLACASIEALTRGLAGELGKHGVRVVGLRPNFTPETVPGTTDEDVRSLLDDTLIGRLPRLSEVAASAVYLASDGAGAMSGAVLNLSCGAIVD